MSWVLDASAVLCWLADEPGAERMEQVLAGDETRVIHAVNLLEIEYYLLRRGEQALQIGLQRLDAVGVEVARDLDDALLLAAARRDAPDHRPRGAGQAGWPGNLFIRVPPMSRSVKYVVLYERAPNNWFVYLPDLPGCVATGDAREEVERLIREAVNLHVAALREEGESVPEPGKWTGLVEVSEAPDR
jgi:predicted RNase H-like HicB family nuclease/PIN domain nuclease of toxin-antitoxin system